MSAEFCNLQEALSSVRERIQAACLTSNRNPNDVTILAVTKGFGAQAISGAIAAGLCDIGENYFQEAVEKFAHVTWPAKVRRHFIGRVQRNKARRIAAAFDVVQTVDDPRAARALDEGAAAANKLLDVLIQVNVSGDERQGIAPEWVAEFFRELKTLPNLRARGLMVIGPHDRALAQQAFERAEAVFKSLRAASSGIDTLSMGMSDDLDVAVAAGSTMVRIGTALFGMRTPKASAQR
jgi:pyridoxal phosphate enzyme (YggS family)